MVLEELTLDLIRGSFPELFADKYWRMRANDVRKRDNGRLSGDALSIMTLVQGIELEAWSKLIPVSSVERGARTGTAHRGLL
jgi:hypothetical protein